MHCKKLDEEEISTNNVVPGSTNGESTSRPSSADSQQQQEKVKESPKVEKHADRPSSPILEPSYGRESFYDNAAVLKSNPSDTVETATEMRDLSFNDRHYQQSKTNSNNNNNSNNSHTVLQSLTSKLFLTADGYEFRRLQQLRSDTASEVVQFDPEFAYESDGVVFEKVKYKQHVRYLRHTPSTTSLDNFPPNNTAAHSEPTVWKCTRYGNNNNNNNNTKMVLVSNNNNNNNNNMGQSGMQSNLQLPVNVSLGSKLNGNYQNVIISEQRDCFNKLTPVVKWDINGNSLDEDGIFINDNWDDFDNCTVYAHEKRITNLNRCDESQLSSCRSSSTTLETWIDEELWENNESSYNERHDLQCNLCLMKA